MATLPNIRVNKERLWQSLMDMAKIGATAKGGSCRLALSDEDKAGRDLFVRWCKEAGCSVEIDQMGNIFARRPGRDPKLDPVVTGSHLDTQPTGGKFDGVYGVLAGLEVIRTLNDHGYETDAPVEVTVWTNEEGSRFAPSMIASGVFAGAYSVADAHAIKDVDGNTMGAELKRIGYLGDRPCGGQKFRAFFEAHIEQGPILEAQKRTIGVVTGAQGLRWFDVTITGQEAHAGSTPMPRRRDALVGAFKVIDRINAIALAHAPYGVSTVGVMRVMPASRNTIPGSVYFSVDMRHPDDATLTAMHEALKTALATTCGELGLAHELTQVAYTKPVVFDRECVSAVRAAAKDCGFDGLDIISGAGHDACYVNRVAPTAMVFVPCADGISHNEIESATPEDLAAGCDVLLRAMLGRAVL